MNMLFRTTALTTVEPLVIRASSVSTYPDCPRRWAARHLWREVIAAGYELQKLPNGIGAAVGTAVHAAGALILTEKASTGRLPPITVGTDCAVESIRAGIREGVMWDQTTENLNTAEQQVARMTRAYATGIAPKVNPVLIETRLEARISDELMISGQKDVLAREPKFLRDTKTGKRGNHKPQLGTYSLLAKTHGFEVEGIIEDFVERVPLSKPPPDPVSFVHDLVGAESAAWAVIRHIQADLKVWREGAPEMGMEPMDPWAFAANPNSRTCSAKYCPAHGTAFCREHQTNEME